MKVIAYNIQQSEKEQIIKANAKKHDITVIANALDEDTLAYASGKEAILISERDFLNSQRVQVLYGYGIRKIITRSAHINHIHTEKAATLGISVKAVDPHLSEEQRAWQIIDLLSETF